MGKKSLNNKSKGPKGKKARAKAKLERRWGEEINEDAVQAARLRKGRSRLLPRMTGSGSSRSHADDKNGTEKRAASDADGDLGDADNFSISEDDSDSDESVERGNFGAENCDSLVLLLNKINTKKGGDRCTRRKNNRTQLKDKASRLNADDEDEFLELGEEEGDSEDEMSFSNASGSNLDESRERGGNDAVGEGDPNFSDFDHDDNDNVPSFNRKDCDDSFTLRFSRPALADDEKVIAMQHAQPSKTKIPTHHLDPALELHLSSHIFDDLSSSGGPLRQLKNDDVKSSSSTHKSSRDLTAEICHQRNTKKVLRQKWTKFNEDVVYQNVDGAGADSDANYSTKNRSSDNCSFSALQSTLFPALVGYADVLLTMANRENRHGIDNILALHLLNHVLKSRSRVQKHNRRIKQLSQQEDKEKHMHNQGAAAPVNVNEDEDRKYRDQGYTRPKVLVLLPTRSTCLDFVHRMLALLDKSAIVDNLDRFDAEYAAPLQGGTSTVVQTGEDDARRKSVLQAKGPEWQELFGDNANDDDDFKLGIAITPSAKNAAKNTKNVKAECGTDQHVSVRLYTDFYRSDIVIASPLGLKMVMAEDEGGDKEDVDFLSSIEICLVARADVLLMQNWDHVNRALSSINQQPRKNNDTDFSRVRNYLLAGQAAHWRQLIVVSSFTDPHIMSSFKRSAKSISGQLKLRRKVPADEASACNVLSRVKQVFQRVACTDFSRQGADRLAYFSNRVLPQILRLQQKHTLIFIPSYFDFVSVRNILLKREASFVSVTEYARVSEVSRGRARFHQGQKQIMLYTGRAHFFLRHNIKGARHIVFFGLPEHAEFYPGLINTLEDVQVGDGSLDLSGAKIGLEATTSASCLVLFTKYDAQALERVVGTRHCDHMIKGKKSTYLFCS